MSKATEALEVAEHAAGHGDGGGHGGESHNKAVSRSIGLSMAILGVLLAFCAAMVGSARTELVKTMVEQTQTNNEFQAESMKYRMMITQLESIRATSPTRADIEEMDAAITRLRATAPEPSAAVLEAFGSTTRRMAQMLIPDPASMNRFVGLVHKYQHERAVAHEWAEAYEPAIHAHFEAAEGFERAQLCAEIGIVIASIALLLASKRVWFVSLALGALCVGFLGYTYSQSHAHLAGAEHAIEHAAHEYRELRRVNNAASDDAAVLASVVESLHAPQAAHSPQVRAEAGHDERAANPAAPDAAAHAEPNAH